LRASNVQKFPVRISHHYAHTSSLPQPLDHISANHDSVLRDKNIFALSKTFNLPNAISFAKRLSSSKQHEHP
jgi:hypothetical protein